MVQDCLEAEIFALARMFLVGMADAPLPDGLPAGSAHLLLDLWNNEEARRSAVGPAFYFLFLDDEFRHRVAQARRELWGTTGRYRHRDVEAGAEPRVRIEERETPYGPGLTFTDPLPIPLEADHPAAGARATKWLIWGDFESPWTVAAAADLGFSQVALARCSAFEPGSSSVELRVYSAKLTAREVADKYLYARLLMLGPSWEQPVIEPDAVISPVERCWLDKPSRGPKCIVMRFADPFLSRDFVQALYEHLLLATDWREHLYDAFIMRSRRSPKRLATLVRSWTIECLVQRGGFSQRGALRLWNKHMPSQFRVKVGKGPLIESGETQASRDRKDVRATIDLFREF